MHSRQRDLGRQYLSGADKRKKKDEKEKKENEELAKMPKLTHFFRRASSGTVDSENDVNEASGSSSIQASEIEGEQILNEGEQILNEGEQILDEGEQILNRDEQSTNESEQISDEGESIANDDEQILNEEDQIFNATVEDNDDAEILTGGNFVRQQITSTDLGSWPSNIDQVSQDFLIRRGSQECQHKDGDFLKSQRFYENEKKKNRFCNKSLFHFVHSRTKESLERNWLCYSPTKGCLFCFPCKVLNKKTDKFTDDGFNDWKHVSARLTAHEKSAIHRNSLISITSWQAEKGLIDSQIQKKIEEKQNYWRLILERNVEVIKFLAKKGLAFRGDIEKIGSEHNGNYLGILELLAKFDPLLKQHIQDYAEKGKGNTSYLSHGICDEIIEILAKEVLSYIIKELKEQKYFSISLDSTPDLSHVDQLTFIIRYVLPSGPVERFIKFLEMEGHSAAQMFQSLTKFTSDNDIDMKNCRGQSYDNATNMSGRYNGLQAKVKELCEYAEFIPCFGHSLNLVGTCCAECCRLAVLFFTFLNGIYNFFSASNYRWRLLMDTVKNDASGLTLKQLCGTRWAERADATRAIHQNYSGVMELLLKISEDPNFKAEVRVQAEGFLNTMKKLETGFMTVFWDKILQKFQQNSAALQAEDLCLNRAYSLLESLSSFVESLRSEFSSFEQQAKSLTGNENYQDELRRQRRRNPRYDDVDEVANESISPAEDFKKNTFSVILDNLKSELTKRTKAYEKLSKTFGFLHNLHEASVEDINSGSQNLIVAYPDDLEDSLGDELIQFSALLKTNLGSSMSDDKNRETQMYRLLTNHKLEATFPNVSIVLRIYLSLMVTNCSGERSFSKLKRIKNEQRTSLGQNKLNYLSLLSLESEVLEEKIDVQKIISKFASLKARKQHI